MLTLVLNLCWDLGRRAFPAPPTGVNATLTFILAPEAVGLSTSPPPALGPESALPLPNHHPKWLYLKEPPPGAGGVVCLTSSSSQSPLIHLCLQVCVWGLSPVLLLLSLEPSSWEMGGGLPPTPTCSLKAKPFVPSFLRGLCHSLGVSFLDSLGSLIGLKNYSFVDYLDFSCC